MSYSKPREVILTQRKPEVEARVDVRKTKNEYRAFGERITDSLSARDVLAKKWGQNGGRTASDQSHPR